jgi:hypothetical protein
LEYFLLKFGIQEGKMRKICQQAEPEGIDYFLSGTTPDFGMSIKKAPNTDEKCLEKGCPIGKIEVYLLVKKKRNAEYMSLRAPMNIGAWQSRDY